MVKRLGLDPYQGFPLSAAPMLQVVAGPEARPRSASFLMVFRKMAISEFSRALSTLLAGGIPLVSALENSVSAVANVHIRSRLEPLIGAVRQGQPLYASLPMSSSR